MDIELIKTLLGNGGSTAVCLVLVYWFLRYIKEANDTYSSKIEAVIDRLADKFGSELTAARSAFQGQITDLTNQVFNVSLNTGTTLTKLSDAIDELRDELRTKVA